jgi:hypothetical protein
MDCLVSAFGKSNLFAHVACSKEDCLAKLIEKDIVAEALPVGLGGSWTGGCEPWRRTDNVNGDSESDDALTPEIETDLTCLFRNSIWSYNQAATAARNQPTALMSSRQDETEDAVSQGIRGETSRIKDTSSAPGNNDNNMPITQKMTDDSAEDKKANRRRRMHIQADRVRRVRQRIEIEVLHGL